jgi:hypothetical protein
MYNNKGRSKRSTWPQARGKAATGSNNGQKNRTPDIKTIVPVTVQTAPPIWGDQLGLSMSCRKHGDLNSGERNYKNWGESIAAAAVSNEVRQL